MALYDSIGRNYAGFRRPDDRIAAAIDAALGDAASLVNIGAGTGRTSRATAPCWLSSPPR